MLKVWFKVYVLGTLAAFLLELIYLTLRWQKNDLKSFAVDAPVIGAFWHGHQLMMGPLSRTLADSKRFRIKMLISNHSDGRLIARAVRWFGIQAIHGSSSKGGARAIMMMKDALSNDFHVAITPDGPKGPIYQVKSGIVSLAASTGCKIIPVAVGFSDFWQINSWDKMMVPKPFCRAVCLVGEEVNVPSDMPKDDINGYQLLVKQQLDKVSESAKNYFLK